MKKTIKNKIFSFNLLTMLLLIIITALAFTLSARMYLERESLDQLQQIASGAKRVVVSPHRAPVEKMEGKELISSYVSLIKILRAPTSFFNVEYALIDDNDHILTPYKDFADNPTDLELKIINTILTINKDRHKNEIIFSYDGVDYAAVIKEVKEENRYKLGKIVIYTNVEKINQMQTAIIFILMGILVIASLIVMIISSFISKNISSPLSKLCSHIRSLSERNFSRFQIPADNEIQELVYNINTMTEKLESYDKSQKTFLQNVSHEFRTPIMSIQSHAEGIKYDVIDGHDAAEIIIKETKRLTHMVEELLYLSRLDAIEEKYHYYNMNLVEVIQECIHRMMPIAVSLQKEISFISSGGTIGLMGDGEKMIRAISNLINNCVRFAKSHVKINLVKENERSIQLIISDDGPGFSEGDLINMFTRFYKGVNGEVGLGLAITKTIIQKHGGSITARNMEPGALFEISFPLKNQ